MGRASRQKWQARLERASGVEAVDPKNRSRKIRTSGFEVILTIVLFLMPKEPVLIVLLLLAIAGLLMKYAWEPWFHPVWASRTVLLGSSFVLCFLLGLKVWPKVTVSPRHLSIQNGQTYRFRVKNETSDDVYSVSPLVYVDTHSALTDFDISIEDPTWKFGPTSLKCSDRLGRKVLVPVFSEISPGQERWFTVTYKGTATSTLKSVDPAIDTRPGPSGEIQGSYTKSPRLRLPPDAGGGTCSFGSRLE